MVCLEKENKVDEDKQLERILLNISEILKLMVSLAEDNKEVLNDIKKELDFVRSDLGNIHRRL